MAKLTAIEIRTINEAVTYGFTFRADGHFRNWKQGNSTIGKLVKIGALVPNPDASEYDFHPTQLARDVIRYGSLEAALA